jgi:hypothetical protein
MFTILVEILNLKKFSKIKSNTCIYNKWILKKRSFLNVILFKIVLILFFLFCLFQYYLYHSIQKVFSFLNMIFGIIKYTPFLYIQNQLIYKTNLISNKLQDNLK